MSHHDVGPNNNAAISSVGDDLGEGSYKYIGTVVGIDGCVCGITDDTYRIVKFDPINDTTSFVGKKVDSKFLCNGDGALGTDGCICAGRQDGRIMKINTHNDPHCDVGNSIDRGITIYSDTILGIDGCIYWPSAKSRRIRKYDPHTYQSSLVGIDFGSEDHKQWYGGCLASDGVI